MWLQSERACWFAVKYDGKFVIDNHIIVLEIINGGHILKRTKREVMNGICHIDIPCTDMEKIGKFYTYVFDWKIIPILQMNYVLWKAPDGPGDTSIDLAFFLKPGRGRPSHPAE